MKISIHIFLLLIVACATSFAQEKHLKNIRQLTFGGDNAEAYFSPDGKKLTFQSNNPAWGLACDQIFEMDIEKALKDKKYKPRMVSNGEGRTTCSYYLPDGKSILYASTFKGSKDCPPVKTEEDKYVWNIYEDFDIFVANEKGEIKKQLTNLKGYDAEATVSPKGDKIVYTSMQTGDLELWTMNIDGTDQKSITQLLGYDGGAFFSPDGSKIVFRSSRPHTDEEFNEYIGNLNKGLVSPTNMEIYTCNADGSNLFQVTNLGKANWAPFYHPAGDKIIFSSNHQTEEGYNFQLFMIKDDGTELEQITDQSKFNAFPMFSPDGKYLVFSSNRNNGNTKDTNLFIAEWVE